MLDKTKGGWGRSLRPARDLERKLSSKPEHAAEAADLRSHLDLVALAQMFTPSRVATITTQEMREAYARLSRVVTIPTEVLAAMLGRKAREDRINAGHCPEQARIDEFLSTVSPWHTSGEGTEAFDPAFDPKSYNSPLSEKGRVCFFNTQFTKFLMPVLTLGETNGPAVAEVIQSLERLVNACDTMKYEAATAVLHTDLTETLGCLRCISVPLKHAHEQAGEIRACLSMSGKTEDTIYQKVCNGIHQIPTWRSHLEQCELNLDILEKIMPLVTASTTCLKEQFDNMTLQLQQMQLKETAELLVQHAEVAPKGPLHVHL